MTSRSRPALHAGLMIAAGLMAGCNTAQEADRDPDAVSFATVAGRIPNATVRSEAEVVTGFDEPATLDVEGEGVRVVTRDGKQAPPFAIAPGEPFQLVAPAPCRLLGQPAP